MYCSKCGYLLDDDDVFCSQCGAKAKKIIEEAIETDSEDVDMEEEDKKIHHNDEFKWSVPEFNVEKKREEVVFDWSQGETDNNMKNVAKNPIDTADTNQNKGTQDQNLEDVTGESSTDSGSMLPDKDVPLPPDEAFEVGGLNEMIDKPDIISTKELEAHLFGDAVDESEQDRFFTFTKKNAEFQKLLNKEYEKIKENTRGIPTPDVQLAKETIIQEHEENIQSIRDTIALDIKEINEKHLGFTKVDVFKESEDTVKNDNFTTVTSENAGLLDDAVHLEKPVVLENEAIKKYQTENIALKDVVDQLPYTKEEKNTSAWTMALEKQRKKVNNSYNLSEIEQNSLPDSAKLSNSGWRAALDKEISKMPRIEESQESLVEKNKLSEIEKEDTIRLENPDDKFENESNTAIKVTSDTLHRIDAFYTDSNEENVKFEKKKHRAGEIIIGIIIALLILIILFELACLIGQMGWPESAFSKTVISIQDIIIKKVSNIFQFVK